MKKHLVLVGGGHAHLTVLMNLGEFISRGHRVTLISPSEFHYYSGMGPGMLGGLYAPEDIRFPVKRMAENHRATCIEGRVRRIDPKARSVVLENGTSIPYDVVSFNIGSYIPAQSLGYTGDGVYTVKPIEMLLKGKNHILRLLRHGTPNILIIGGGPAGLEITGNVWRLVHDRGGTARVTIAARRSLLARFPEKAGRLARKSLSARTIAVLEHVRVERLEQGSAVLSDGRTVSWDICFAALGIKPSPVFKDSEIPTGNDGGLLVNSYLQSTAFPEVFGGGDCISFRERPLDKVGVYAVRENPVLYHNLLAALEGDEMQQFNPQKDYLLLFNLGNGRAIFWRSTWVGEGRLFFRLKDYIDKKFMKKFQIG